MIGLYRAVVELIESKASAEQARAVAILNDCGYKLVEGEGGFEMVEVESETDEAEEPEGHTMGFTGKLKAKPKGN